MLFEYRFDAAKQCFSSRCRSRRPRGIRRRRPRVSSAASAAAVATAPTPAFAAAAAVSAFAAPAAAAPGVRGRASLTVSRRPSKSWPSRLSIAERASSSCIISTNPNPRLRPVSRSERTRPT